MGDKERTARRETWYFDTPEQKTAIDNLAKRKGKKDAADWSKELLFKHLNNYEKETMDEIFPTKRKDINE